MKEYKVAAYLRISKDEYADNKESNSISTQRNLIDSFIEEKNDLKLVNYYVDDGYSGTDFDRPQFKNMIDDIKCKKINTVIVKDLSRFGRNYIEVGNYIENIFLILGIRFISINDNIDSKESSYQTDDIIPIKNVINDLYAKDISRKVRSVLKTKKLNGEFVGRSAPYGYLKNPYDKHKFIIDTKASLIVNKIFDWTLDGKTRRTVADELNKLKILPPGLYKTNNNISNYNLTNTTQCWNSDIVGRILKNRVYTGELIQGKATRLNYRIHKVVSLNPDEWIIINNHHEPIISMDKFEKVQGILSNHYNRIDRFDESNLLGRYLRCVDCNKSLNLKRGKSKEYCYCSSYLKNKNCTKHSIEKDLLEKEVLREIIANNKSIEKLTYKFLNNLIKVIYVYDNKDIKIEYKNSYMCNYDV